MYQKAFHWVHAAFVDAPRRRLTAVQAARGSGVNAAVCAEVLDDLVRAKLLIRTDDNGYALARPNAVRADSTLTKGTCRAPA